MFQFLLAWEARRCRSSSGLNEIGILHIDSDHTAHRRLCKRLECCTFYVLSIFYSFNDLKPINRISVVHVT
jgi:hypothetical protein